MSEEHPSSTLAQEMLRPEQAAMLLRRQDALQREAQAVLAELGLVKLLSPAGTLRQVGSSVLGLMVWRDIDLAVSSPGLDIEYVYAIMQPLYTHPQVNQVRYLNGRGPFNPTGLQINERYYFAVYAMLAGSEWKIDISFWLGAGIHPEPLHEAIEQQLTPDTRLTILWIKDIWYQFPAYRQEVYSTDIYDAVLQHGVRTPTEFDDYLVQRGKPARVL
ncbi:MAG: hypothetical protein M3Z08_18680 [Chloroflexota bacterium]|nr:hypothetical protein [Chloroflexota bacterium]